ncbi:hypothetical protein PENTCL1PPCAC_19579, partial [Pristionchus entomophagus]
QMSLDPVEELVDGLEKMEELYLGNFNQPIETDNEIGKEHGDYFNILGLPTELISYVFSFMSMEDRLRARVNKRLDIIELESKYEVEHMLIEEIEEVPIEVKEWMMEMKDAVDVEDGDEKKEKFDQRITFYKGKSYSSDCMKRIAQNASIGVLKIELSGSEKFHREIFNLIKDINIDFLISESR